VREASEASSKNLAALQGELASLSSTKADKVRACVCVCVQVSVCMCTGAWMRVWVCFCLLLAMHARACAR